MAWSPHQYGVLLSGGGNTDKSLKFWNVSQGALVASVETESQVDSLSPRFATSPSLRIRTSS